MQSGLTGGLRSRLLWRASAGRALRTLDPDGPPRTRLGGPILSALGIYGRVHCASAASDPHLHRVARRSRPHAARQIPHLHFLRIVALVFYAGLLRHEARRALPQIRRRDRCVSAGRDRLVPLVALAEPLAPRPRILACVGTGASRACPERSRRVQAERSSAAGITIHD